MNKAIPSPRMPQKAKRMNRKGLVPADLPVSAIAELLNDLRCAGETTPLLDLCTMQSRVGSAGLSSPSSPRIYRVKSWLGARAAARAGIPHNRLGSASAPATLCCAHPHWTLCHTGLMSSSQPLKHLGCVATISKHSQRSDSQQQGLQLPFPRT